jgi:hypothetical protein
MEELSPSALERKSNQCMSDYHDQIAFISALHFKYVKGLNDALRAVAEDEGIEFQPLDFRGEYLVNLGGKIPVIKSQT